MRLRTGQGQPEPTSCDVGTMTESSSTSLQRVSSDCSSPGTSFGVAIHPGRGEEGLMKDRGSPDESLRRCEIVIPGVRIYCATFSCTGESPMSATVVLLRCVGRAVLNAVGGGIAGDLVCDLLPDVAQNTWSGWSKDRTEQERQAELVSLAQASDDQVRRWVQQTVQEVAGDRPEEVKQSLSAYLLQVPGAIRANMRRPTDPTGRTVPTSVTLRKANDLLPLLPSRRPRFRPGEHPLPGVDLELVELLGIGGFGEVWKARNPNRPRAEPVALKFCLDPQAAEVLRNEVDVLDRVMSQGKHPGIVGLRQTYLRNDPPCLEFEFVEGGDLSGLIAEWHRTTADPPSPFQTERVILHLAEAVGFAHAQNPPIVHRDLKPANVLVSREETGNVIFRISDFGLGGLATTQMTGQGTRGSSIRLSALADAVRGACTPLYASPEQQKGDSPDPRDDVFALG